MGDRGSLTKRAHKFSQKDRAGILGSRLSAEKTTAASGVVAACSGMERGTGGVFFFPLFLSVCVWTRVAESSHAAFLTQLGGFRYACECCMCCMYICVHHGRIRNKGSACGGLLLLSLELKIDD